MRSSNLRAICDEYLEGRYDLEVIDIYQQPVLTKGEQIIAAPTLIKKLPLPMRRIIGDMSNRDRVLLGLDLDSWVRRCRVSAIDASHADDREQTETLRARLAEAEEMLRAIRQGEIDALVVEGAGGNQVYTLHSAEEPYRNLVEQMQEGAVVLTAGGDILYANARFAALVGEPLESVIGSRIGRFVNASDRDEFETLLRRRAAAGGAAG